MKFPSENFRLALVRFDHGLREIFNFFELGFSPLCLFVWQNANKIIKMPSENFRMHIQQNFFCSFKITFYKNYLNFNNILILLIKVQKTSSRKNSTGYQKNFPSHPVEKIPIHFQSIFFGWMCSRFFFMKRWVSVI